MLFVLCYSSLCVLRVGTVYNDYLAVDLARFALKGLLTKTGVDPNSIDYLTMGTVIQEPRTSKYVVAPIFTDIVVFAVEQHFYI